VVCVPGLPRSGPCLLRQLWLCVLFPGGAGISVGAAGMARERCRAGKCCADWLRNACTQHGSSSRLSQESPSGWEGPHCARQHCRKGGKGGCNGLQRSSCCCGRCVPALTASRHTAAPCLSLVCVVWVAYQQLVPGHTAVPVVLVSAPATASWRLHPTVPRLSSWQTASSVASAPTVCMCLCLSAYVQQLGVCVVFWSSTGTCCADQNQHRDAC
jgi:hypothetical protein